MTRQFYPLRLFLLNQTKQKSIEFLKRLFNVKTSTTFVD
eukprot:UN11060